jgi:hypothetical protein
MNVEAQQDILQNVLDGSFYDYRLTLYNNGSPVASDGSEVQVINDDDLWSATGGTSGTDPVQIDLNSDVEFTWGNGTSDLTVDELLVEIDLEDALGFRTFFVMKVEDSGGGDLTWPVNTTLVVPSGSSFIWDQTPDTDAAVSQGILELLGQGASAEFDEFRVQCLDGGSLIGSAYTGTIIQATFAYNSGSNKLELSDSGLYSNEFGPASGTIDTVRVDVRQSAGSWKTLFEDDTLSVSVSGDKWTLNNITFVV